jgi:hypothetical protein
MSGVFYTKNIKCSYANKYINKKKNKSNINRQNLGITLDN